MCDVIKCNDIEDSAQPAISNKQRRDFLAGLVGLPLMTVLAVPEFAKAAANNLQNVEIPVGNHKMARGALALPKGNGKHPTILLFHEWWGLNDQIKAVAAEFANQGYIALAVDLYGGQVATTREEARALTTAFDFDQSLGEIKALADFLGDHPRSTGKMATLGWCFGGGVSISTALAMDVDAAIIYYGRVPQSAQTMKNLRAPVLGHFGTLDKSINREMVDGFQQAATDAGVDHLLELHWYEADHAFANPTGSRYDDADAALAFERSLAFLDQNLS